jgi:hypothetical protein
VVALAPCRLKRTIEVVVITTQRLKWPNEVVALAPRRLKRTIEVVVITTQRLKWPNEAVVLANLLAKTLMAGTRLTLRDQILTATGLFAQTLLAGIILKEHILTAPITRRTGIFAAALEVLVLMQTLPMKTLVIRRRLHAVFAAVVFTSLAGWTVQSASPVPAANAARDPNTGIQR